MLHVTIEKCCYSGEMLYVSLIILEYVCSCLSVLRERAMTISEYIQRERESQFDDEWKAVEWCDKTEWDRKSSSSLVCVCVLNCVCGKIGLWDVHVSSILETCDQATVWHCTDQKEMELENYIYKCVYKQSVYTDVILWTIFIYRFCVPTFLRKSETNCDKSNVSYL